MLSWQVLAMGSEEANVSEDVLKTYEFHVQIAEEDVRDGDANPWERVVADLAAEVRRLRENEVCADTECRDLHIRELRARVAELETRLNPPCPDPGIDAFYLDADEASRSETSPNSSQNSA